MADTAAPGARIATLDIVRGVAVMGILAMNIVAFAMPSAAYLNPTAYGTESQADIASWIFSFVLVDGKMRGLFSFLFGASILLVMERAEASGRSPAGTHFSRMFWLLLFGLIHFYFIWWGDILSLYAPVGMVAFFFRRATPKTLITIACGLILIQFLMFASFTGYLYATAAAAAVPGASTDAVANWQAVQTGLAPYPPQELADILARYRGPYAELVRHNLSEALLEPLTTLRLFSAETLAYMLFGMAALKSGFLAGAWQDRAYVRTVAIGFGIGIPAYSLLAWAIVRENFGIPILAAASIAAPVIVRPAMILGYAALIILLTRSGGALTQRIAATGRAAFTNYLGTSILMTTLFYGFGLGLFGTFSRVELWLVVVAMWTVMLAWSKPWLDRFRYGPFEWLWRSLARFEIQPMRRAAPA
jgi:uncharacterized protein